MTRAGQFADSRANWCPTRGVGTGEIKEGLRGDDLRCPVCGRVFAVNASWLRWRRLPLHKPPRYPAQKKSPSAEAEGLG